MTPDREEYVRAARTFEKDELAVAVSLTIRLHKNGAMSVDGPVGDKAFCKKLLDEAWAAINRSQPTLITPASDVDSKPRESYLAP